MLLLSLPFTLELAYAIIRKYFTRQGKMQNAHP